MSIIKFPLFRAARVVHQKSVKICAGLNKRIESIAIKAFITHANIFRHKAAVVIQLKNIFFSVLSTHNVFKLRVHALSIKW